MSRRGITVDQLIAFMDKKRNPYWESFGYKYNMSLEKKRAWIQDVLDELEEHGIIGHFTMGS